MPVEVPMGFWPADIAGIHPSSVLAYQRFRFVVVVNMDCGVVQLKFLDVIMTMSLDCDDPADVHCRYRYIRLMLPLLM